jgi:cell division protein FtsI/penicillin-binding protein 2
VLTLDPNIQIEAERILVSAVERHAATGGSVIVQDPVTGKILAMASAPAFDPNAYQESPIDTFLNPAVQEIYEPGSVFKVITMAAGIDAGKITPHTTFYDEGVLTVSGRKIQNWDRQAHGLVTMTTVIEKSLNTGAAFVERQTGHAMFREYLRKFGFDEKTGIDLPGELAGDLRRLSPNAPAVAYATASFGQGVAVTALQMVNAISAIANGGLLMHPYVLAELGPREVRRVISPDTAQAVTRMMVSAVDRAEVAKIEGFAFAGKTGTAQVPDFERGGYSDEVIHTYVGFGPATHPRFVVLIKLDKPAGAPLAGTTVVPAFRDLAQFLVNYYHIAPDRSRH